MRTRESWPPLAGESRTASAELRPGRAPRPPEGGGPGEKSVWKGVFCMCFRKAAPKKEMGYLQRLHHRIKCLKKVRASLPSRNAMAWHEAKVLYVYEGISGSVGEAMAAARDRATRYSSVQQDTILGYPIQVPLPDGEERQYTLPSMKHHLTGSEQEAEITREYIKPPANKTLFDVECDVSHRSCSEGSFPIQSEWGVGHGGSHHHSQHQQHRYSAPMDPRATQHPAVSASSSSSSSSSSLPGWGCGDEGRGSPRRMRKPGGLGQRGTQLLANMVAPFTSPKYAPHQEGSRRGGRHQGMGTSSPSPSHDINISMPYCPAATTLADITMVSVPCGPSARTAHSPSHSSVPGGSQGVHMSSMGLPHTSGQSSQSRCSPTADHDFPPLYTEVIENPTLYTSVSRPSEPRTNSGKI
ncbi:uncharacterized protein LOC134781058 isoform X1 [Penaeus indicus]|uniref:uncharacterized protein LOC134781058 isoform X1 n=1 Tax=Penaeus indicus TaxID=29960 RepID=UPI00300D6ABC